MKKYRELTISGTRDLLFATMEEIEKALIDGWNRNRKIENVGLAPTGLSPEEMRFCFTCASTAARKGSVLVLMSDRDGNLALTNIVPDERGQLTPDEFNYILEEFLQKFARPTAEKTGVTIDASSGTATIEDWFSAETAGKLRRFLKLSHGSTSHPENYKLWMAFLVSAHREDAKVHGDLLRRWLTEDAGCDEYLADELAAEFESVGLVYTNALHWAVNELKKP